MNDFMEIISGIRSIINGRQSVADISKLLYDHGCFYLISKMKEQNEYTQKLQSELPLNQICIKERYIACSPIFNVLEQINIPYSIIKGAVLSQTAYGDVNIRKSGDIDLLIRRSDIDTVKKYILQNGFVQGRVTDGGLVPFTRKELIFQTGLSHQTAPFVKESGNPMCPYINVDINMDILWGESKRQSDMDYVLSQTESMEIYGFSVKKLSPAMEFIALCLHHYKDMNSIYLLAGGSLKLSLFCDIYFYLKNNRIDVDELKQSCKRLDVTEFIYYCVYYANEIFADDLLHTCLIALESEKNKDILYTFGLDSKERRIWTIPFKERLFCEDFKNKFMESLNENDLEKIRLNKLAF